MFARLRSLLALAAAVTLVIAPAAAHAQLVQYLKPDGYNRQAVSAATPLPTSASLAAFNPTGTTTLSVSAVSARVALPSADPTAVIRNTGATDAFLAFGNGSVTATTSGTLLPAGQAVAYNVGSAIDVAAITASGTTTLSITTGTGLPALTGGGGSGGGGAVTVADGADVTEGAKADAACAAPGNTCSMVAVLKGILTAAQDTTTASAVNQTQVAGTAVATGNGVVGAGVQRVAIASDNTAFAVNAAITAALNAIADGANVTLGAKADPACGTAAGTCTELALLKFLNTNVTAATPAGTNIIGKTTTDQTTHGTTDLVASDMTKIGGTTILTGTGAQGAGSQRVTVATDSATVAGSASLPTGSNVIGKASIDQTTPGQGGTNSVYLNSAAFDVATTITRPANTTAYTAGDTLGGALDLGVLGPSGKAVHIASVQLEADIAAIPTGQTSWVLYLYNVTPPSATADNGAWDLPSGDRASFLGSIAIPAMADLGSTLYVESNNVGKQVILSGTHLFGYLVTVAGFTPAANSEVYKLTLHTKAD